MPLKIKINVTGATADKLLEQVSPSEFKQYRAVSEKLLIESEQIMLSELPVGGVLYSKAYIYDNNVIIAEIDGLTNNSLVVSLPAEFNGKHALVSYLAEVST